MHQVNDPMIEFCETWVSTFVIYPLLFSFCRSIFVFQNSATWLCLSQFFLLSGCSSPGVLARVISREARD